MMRPFHTSALLIAGLLITCIASSARGDTTLTFKRSAESYYQTTQNLFQRLRDQLPTITHSASIAAKLYVDDPNMGIGVDGDPAFCSELVGRAGGIMAIGEGLSGRAERGWKGIILYCLSKGGANEAKQSASDVAKIKMYKAAGCHVLVFGSRQLIEMESQGAKPDDAIEIPSFLAEIALTDVKSGKQTESIIEVSSHGFSSNNEQYWGVPTYQLTEMSAGWIWCAEFVGACSRLGKTPVMFQSIMVPTTGWARLRQYTLPNSPLSSYQKFHEDSATTQPASTTQPIIKADPAPEGQLGAQWISKTSEGLAWIHEHQQSSIEKAGKRCAKALAEGHHLFWATEGHGTSCVVNVADSPGLFDADVKKIQKNDLLVFMGYDKIMNDESSGHFADSVVRKNGASAIWICTTDYRKDQLTPVGDEMLIDTHWQLGDAVVTFPGYDIKILPSSGVLTTAVFMMIQAETLGNR